MSTTHDEFLAEFSKAKALADKHSKVNRSVVYGRVLEKYADMLCALASPRAEAAHPAAVKEAEPDNTKMWAVHIEGPDDVHAVPDREIADAACVALNWSFKRSGLADLCTAKVIEWPHGYESWAAQKDLFRLEAVPTPRASTDEAAGVPSVLAARGYVAFGSGVYRIQQTKEPGLVVTFRRDGEHAHSVGDRASEVDPTPIPAEEIIVRLDFTSEAGLDSLESHLREIRAEHWPTPVDASQERTAFESATLPDGHKLDFHTVIGDYLYMETRWAWRGWQARAALSSTPATEAAECTFTIDQIHQALLDKGLMSDSEREDILASLGNTYSTPATVPRRGSFEHLQGQARDLANNIGDHYGAWHINGPNSDLCTALRRFAATPNPPTATVQAKCKGDPGECDFNKACMYACGATVQADREDAERLDIHAQRLALFEAIKAVMLGNKTDDKLIVAELHKAGFCIARASTAAPKERT